MFSVMEGVEMTALHIVQGGIKNGDKKWLERAASLKLRPLNWVAPKTAIPGDEVVVFVGGYGFFATGRVTSRPKKRDDWPGRYGADIGSIRLIKPAISISAIQRALPELTWANYPRSITTPSPEVAERVRRLISRRRKTGLPEGLDNDDLATANIEELRAAALLRARSVAEPRRGSAIYRVRSLAIHRYVLCRANGRCEGCDAKAPFRKPDGSPYLEPHHTTRLADDGPDHPAHVIGVCPNCHRRAHHSLEAEGFNRSLKAKAARLEVRTVPTGL